jgi:putative tributyrin esterase
MAQIHCNFFSYSLGYGVDILVVLPSFSPCDMQKGTPSHKIPYKYPVLYLLHGHGNDYMCWSRFTSMERYVEERRIAVVTCSVGNKGYMNAEAYGENYYDFVARELPEFVTANFPVSARMEDTYIAGLSMGGYGTLAHGLGHPESYRAIGAFSPATEWKSDTELRLGHGFPKMMDLYALVEEDLKKEMKLPAIFLCVGKQDFLYESVVRFHHYLEEKGTAHRFDDVDGYEHEWSFWDFELPKFLDWLPRTDEYVNFPLHKM